MSIDPRSLGYFLASLAPVVLISVFAEQIRALVGPVGWLVVFILGAACFFVFAHRYIRRLDEAAWQAQKHAWFWGGSIGIAIAVLTLLPAIQISRPWVDDGDGGDLYAKGVIMGVCYVVVLQCLGFLVGWVAWWIRRS